MGTAKALLDADGRTFLERVVAFLTAGGCAPVLVVVEDLRSPVAAVARTAGCTPVLNPDAAEGPISSIRAGIAALPTGVEAFVVCPVDHPRVEPGTVAGLLAGFIRGRPPLAIPTLDGERGHPTLFSAELIPELLEPGLEEGARTVVLRHLERALLVPVDDEGVMADIDTLPEYRRFYPASYRKRFHAR